MNTNDSPNSESPASLPEASAIAERLTHSQRRIIAGETQISGWNGKTLAEMGLLVRDVPPRTRHGKRSYRFTPLGLAVRTLLKDNQDG